VSVSFNDPNRPRGLGPSTTKAPRRRASGGGRHVARPRRGHRQPDAPRLRPRDARRRRRPGSPSNGDRRSPVGDAAARLALRRARGHRPRGAASAHALVPRRRRRRRQPRRAVPRARLAVPAERERAGPLAADRPADFVAFDRASLATPPRVVAGWFKTAHERAAEASGTGLVNPLDDAARLRRLSGLADRAPLSGAEGPKPARAYPPIQTWPERSYRRWLDVASEPAT